MYIFIGVVVFVLGLIMGSFLNVVGIRVPKGEPFANDRSACPHCNHELKWYELIPILSYLFQGAKCRGCKAHISIQYPLIELATGILFLLVYLNVGITYELGIGIILMSLVVVIMVSDLAYMIIPDKILLFFMPLFILGRILLPLDPWWSPIAGFLIGYIIVFIIITVSGGGMGGGDMKLFAVLGIVLGYKLILLTFAISFIIGAILGGLLLLFKVISRKQPFPFGPSILLAGVVSYLWGEKILTWYFNFY